MSICIVDNCNRPRRGKQDYCEIHYRQVKKFGTYKKISHKDKNEIFITDDISEIVLYDIENKEIARAIIDTEDIDRVSNIKWHLHGKYVRSGNGVYLHRFIVGYPNNKQVDHINHNPLDNRKTNLRLCSSIENTRNATAKSTNTSGVKGVSWNNSRKRWEAKISVNYKTIHLGRFKDIEDATEARVNAELKYFGEFANPCIEVNFNGK